MTKVNIVQNKNGKLVRFDSLKNGTLLYDTDGKDILLKIPKVNERHINVMYFGGDNHGNFGLLYDEDLVTVINEIKVEILS